MIEGTGFHSVTEFAVYVLRDLASSQAPPTAAEEDGLTSEEVAAIRRRLQSLGYLED